MRVRKNILIVIFVFLVSSIGLASIPLANAHGIVDQIFGPIPATLGVPIANNIGLTTYQEFTATVPDISGVDLYLGGGDINTRITVFVRGQFDNTVNAQNNYNPGCPCAAGTLIHVDFTGAQIGPLFVGGLNKLDVYLGPASSPTPVIWDGSNVGTYPGGTAVYPGSIPSDDLFFATYFLGGPVGGTSIPIDSVSLIVAGAETNAMWFIPAIILVGAGAGIAIVKLRKR